MIVILDLMNLISSIILVVHSDGGSFNVVNYGVWQQNTIQLLSFLLHTFQHAVTNKANIVQDDYYHTENKTPWKALTAQT